MKNLQPQGDYIIIEKIDYKKEQTTDSGIIITKSQMLDSNFEEAKVLAMGAGLPLPNGDIPKVDYHIDPKVLNLSGSLSLGG